MNTGYRRRVLDDMLDVLMAEASAVALAGPKAVGKTATAQQRAATVFRLDQSVDRETLAAAPHRLGSVRGPVLIDEWQYLPEVWNDVRRLVDDGAPPGRFLLAGSAAPRDAAIHSGAGRILPLRMRPMTLAERGISHGAISLERCLAGLPAAVEAESPCTYEDYLREITRSGFPGIRHLTPQVGAAQLAAYVDNIVEREFAEQGLRVRRPNTLRRWLRAYAAATGTTASYSAILDAATPGESDKPSARTTLQYRDVLASLWMLDEVGPWDPAGAPLARIAQTPKHFIADPALAATLLELDEEALIAGAAEPAFGPRYGSIAGRLFEALVALDLQVYALAAGAKLSHLRTRDGDHEVDFIVQRGQRVVAIEVKLTPSVSDHDVRHLCWLRDKLGPRLVESLVITTGPHAYRRSRDGVVVLPAALLGP